MTNIDVMYSHNKDEWGTPPLFLQRLDDELGYGFDLDPCTSQDNPLNLDDYFTKEDNGLLASWRGYNAVFVNPPYSQNALWLPKIWNESRYTPVVALLPARTDTISFHEYCARSTEIIFVKGRIRFVGGEAGAPFPSIVVVFTPECHRQRMPPRIHRIDFTAEERGWPAPKRKKESK